MQSHINIPRHLLELIEAYGEGSAQLLITLPDKASAAAPPAAAPPAAGAAAPPPPPDGT